MKILCLDKWGEKAKEILEEIAEIKECCIYTQKDHAKLYGIEKVDGIITSLSCPFDKNLLSRLIGLRFIASATTGLDHLPFEYLKERGIKILSLQGESDFLKDVHATAEHTWALILSLIRKVPWAFDDVKQGNWNREAWQGTELHGKTLGIVGMGRVGTQVARIAEGFGMNVTYYDKESPYGLNILLLTSDIISVHVPLTEETRGMFGVKEFLMMKPTAYFVNTSRGAVVDEKALLYSLHENKIKGAAIDVLRDEKQMTESDSLPLFRYATIRDNLIITPHLAGNTAESRELTQIFIANKIKEYINGL